MKVVCFLLAGILYVSCSHPGQLENSFMSKRFEHAKPYINHLDAPHDSKDHAIENLESFNSQKRIKRFIPLENAVDGTDINVSEQNGERRLKGSSKKFQKDIEEMEVRERSLSKRSTKETKDELAKSVKKLEEVNAKWRKEVAIKLNNMSNSISVLRNQVRYNIRIRYIYVYE